MSNSTIEQEEQELEQVSFAKKELPKDDMDMTPMVDLAFLLAAAASFTLYHVWWVF